MKIGPMRMRRLGEQVDIQEGDGEEQVEKVWENNSIGPANIFF